MIALIIIGCVLAFLCLLLFLPVTVKIKYSDKADIKLYFAGIIPIYNSSKKQNEPEVEASADETDKPQENEAKGKIAEFFSCEYERLGTKEFIIYYAGVLKKALTELLWFLRKLRVKLLLLDLTVATDNAFDTAIEYGAVCAAVYPVLSVICSNAKVKAKKINISSDFLKTGYDVTVDINFSAGLIFIFCAAVKLYRIYLGVKEESKCLEDKTNE